MDERVKERREGGESERLNEGRQNEGLLSLEINRTLDLMR